MIKEYQYKLRSVNMQRITSKGSLAVVLSQLEGFNSAKVSSEQYSTDSEIASCILWNAAIRKETLGKTVVDLGCGTGILGLGTMLVGAKRVIFVEKDPKALEIAKRNYERLKSEFKLVGDAIFELKGIEDLNIKADLVVQNPPFGTKIKHTDKLFLDKAFETANVVYSFHKANTKGFIETFARDKGFNITDYWEFDFPLKATMPHHEKRIQRIKVGCWRFEKQKTL